MKRTKLKIPRATPRAHRDIATFFTSGNKGLPPQSPERSAVPCKTDPQVRNGDVFAAGPRSPLKRSILGVIENLLPPSPDLLVVPETQSSQIPLSPSRGHEELSPGIRRETSPGKKPAGLSPICQSPRSKRPSLMSDSERGTCGLLKRLCSPSEELREPKRPRTANALEDSPEEEHKHEGETAFTAIIEQTTAESKMVSCLACTPDEQDAQPAAPTRSEEENKKDAPKTASESSDRVEQEVKSSDVNPAGENTKTTLEEGLDELWFAEQMEPSECLVADEKARKLPDHLILGGGPNNRYWVLNVDEGPDHKVLTVTRFRSLRATETCLLKDGWEMMPVCRGDVVHLEGRADAGSWVLDREQGLLVLLPDYLVSGTSISSSIRCMRRAVLGEMFKSFDGGSKQMLNGTIIHQVFQRAATAKDFSLASLSNMAEEALHSPQHLGAMYSLGVTQDEMKQELHDYLPSLELWAKDYLVTPKAIRIQIPSSGGGAAGRAQDSAAATITELADIEENVWSPRFGLKGKIDLTARVRIQRTRNVSQRSSEVMTIPLELKTGRESNSIEHRSQVILYTLMTSDRYNPPAGFLLYLKTGNLHPIVASHMDHRELLKLRNTLVHYIHNSVQKGVEGSHLARLPDIVTDKKTCQYCPQRRNCALYERVLEGASSDVSDDFLQQETGHLTATHLDYFAHWLLLCHLEAASMEARNGRKRVWLQTPEESEKKGSCIGNLRLIGSASVQSEGVFLHRFQRPDETHDPSGCGLASGDRVVLSDQGGRFFALATGYLCDVSRTSVSCTLDGDVSKLSGEVFRLDADEGVMGLSTHLTNLSRLMESSQHGDRLRELVVGLCRPEFICNLSSVLPKEAKDRVANILKGLNKPQKQAMKKVLLSKDYTLIVGMPGTGKTTTICTLVRILHACGFSVLLTSYTHSAVDNILLKLKRFKVSFLRLGQGQKVHPDILPYTEETVRKNGVHTLSELEQLYSKELVVGTTCMGIKHPIFTRRRFDFCIVDEASQISQPICLGPLFYANRFVLVGDHQQLAPIVHDKEARSLGMDESLFKRLECHSEAVVHLNVQYRMNRQIMSLSNCLMYDGRLECGSERTASALLSLCSLPSVQSELVSDAHPQQDFAWIQDVLTPSKPVCFLDCSMVPALESVERGGISNHTEAAIIHLLLSLLIKAGCKASDVGVIAPYRQQLRCVSALLQSSAFHGVEVNTVDKYQGRDKSVIVLSFVRSTTEEENLGELLKDWRRLNVAITRAKHKLLMVGSASTLRRYTPVEKLLNHLEQENMIIQLPPSADRALPTMLL
ncbi:DNA replication ATP-dependent helicase/nuclease DNA2 [Syngnathoides biaculeatus]|uniref:DNA replication ATP-dependent helicase/nuclease DNA2 n=1 Tax=Syngnathoides biaculeatus TaxID=300417 RepID=UPI002ADE703C|nr:DNA replication ATP-dependent helicase/nuclease DNA2 [Syngnathoides biaculeatus]